MPVSAVVALRPDSSDFYLTKKQLEFFEMLVSRPVVNRGTVFDHLYGERPDADQPADDKVLDQMLVVIRKRCRVEGVNILTVSEGWSILTREKERARKLLEIAKQQPQKRGGPSVGTSKYSDEKVNKKFEWKIDKDVPLPALDNYGNLKQYFFEDMEIDDSVFIEHKKKTSVKHSIYAVRRIQGHKNKQFFMVEREERGIPGVRVWRVKDK
jgi:hypothetical protein